MSDDDRNKRDTLKGPVEITGKRKQESPLTGKKYVLLVPPLHLSESVCNGRRTNWRTAQALLRTNDNVHAPSV